LHATYESFLSKVALLSDVS